MWNIIKQAQEVAATAASRLQEGGSALLERLDGAEDVDEEYDEEEDGEDGEEKEKGVARSSDVSSPKHAISDTDSLSGDAREDEIAALKELVKVSAIRESELSSVLAVITHQYSSLKDQLKEEHAKTEKMKRAIDRQLGAKAEVASLREKLNEVKQMRDGIKGEVSATLQTLSTSMASEMSNVLQAIQRAGPVSTSPAPSVSVPVPVPVPAAALPAVSSPQPQPGGALLARAERADAAAQALREELEATKERLSKAETKVCEAETLMSSLSKAKDAAGKQQADDLRREIETLTKAEAETKAHFVGKMDKLQAELSASKALHSKQCIEAAASAEKASAELQKQLADAHTAAAVEKEALQKQLADAQKQMAFLQASGSGKHKELAAEKEALQQQLADKDKALAAEIKAMKKQLTDAQKTAASEKEALQKQISDAQKQLASMQAASSDAAAQLADKDKALSAEKDAMKKQLTDVHTAAAAEKEALQKQISEAQKQVASLQSSGSEAAALLSVQLAETQQSSAAEKKALQKQLADKDQALAAEKEAMQKHLADVQKQLAAKGKMESCETEELKKQLAGAQKQLADKDKASAAESEELKKQLSAGKETTKKQLADSRKAAAAEKEGLQKQLVDSQRQVADKDKALAAEKEAMQKQLADVQKQLASLQASGSEAASLLSDAQKAASAEIEGLQKQLTEAQGQVADKDRALAAEIEGLQKQLASLQAASSDAAAQLADKDKALSAEKDAMKKQLAEVHTSAAAEKEVLQKKISEAQKQVADNDKALAAEKEALHKQLADKNKAVSAEAEELKKQLAGAQKQLAGAQKQLADAQKTAASEKEALQKQLADKDKAVSAERETFEKLVADAQKATSTEKEVLRKQLADKDKLWAAERVEREAQQVKLSGLETDLEKRVLENAKLHNQVSEAAARVAGATKAETEAQRRIEELVGALKLAKEEALAATSTCDSARREARELCEKVAKLETVQRASDEAGRDLKQRVDGMVKSEAHLQAQLDEARAAAQLASKAQDELSKMEEKKRRDLDFLKKQNERIAQMQREHAEVQQAQSESLMDLSAQLDDSRTRETASALLASERGAELSSLQKHLATLQEATKHTRSQQESELGAAVATARAAEQELLVLVRRLTEELSAAEQRAADAIALADNASSSSAATLAKIETAALERETALRAEYDGRFKEGQQRLALIEAERTRLENELSEAFSQPSSGSIGSRQRPDRVALGVLDIEGGQAPALNSASSSIASDAGATHDQDQDLHLRDDQKKKDAYSHPRLLQVWALVRTYAPSLLPMLGDNPPQLSRESVANAAFVYTVLIHAFLVYTLLF